MNWQPIETAPKGGGAERITDPAWIEPPIILLKSGEGIAVCYWDWYFAEGGSGFTDGCAWIENFTGEPINLHWTDPVTEWAEIT